MQSRSQKAIIDTPASASALSDPSFIDECLEKILNAAGSSLKHYTPNNKAILRAVMAKILAGAK